MSSKTPKQDLSPLEKAIASLVQLHQRVSDEAFMAAQRLLANLKARND